MSAPKAEHFRDWPIILSDRGQSNPHPDIPRNSEELARCLILFHFNDLHPKPEWRGSCHYSM
jgi:hypothetical protein